MDPIPIYRSDGEWVALLQGCHLYDTQGWWIGWLEGKDVFSRDGECVGYLSGDHRVLRRRIRPRQPLRSPPQPPPTAQVPAKVPLAPLFAELPWEVVDVFEEEPHIFKHISEFKPDWEG